MAGAVGVLRQSRIQMVLLIIHLYSMALGLQNVHLPFYRVSFQFKPATRSFTISSREFLPSFFPMHTKSTPQHFLIKLLLVIPVMVTNLREMKYPMIRLTGKYYDL